MAEYRPGADEKYGFDIPHSCEDCGEYILNEDGWRCECCGCWSHDDCVTKAFAGDDEDQDFPLCESCMAKEE